jgi:hypothetical protein
MKAKSRTSAIRKLIALEATMDIGRISRGKYRRLIRGLLAVTAEIAPRVARLKKFQGSNPARM